jgi:hypothetical protein
MQRAGRSELSQTNIILATPYESRFAIFGVRFSDQTEGRQNVCDIIEASNFGFHATIQRVLLGFGADSSVCQQNRSRVF